MVSLVTFFLDDIPTPGLKPINKTSNALLFQTDIIG